MAETGPLRVFINDNEAETDLLYYEAIAKTILRLIEGSRDKPISIGVHGDWGAGKSTVLALIAAQIKEQEKAAEKEKLRPLCLRFNTWQFQGFEDVKTALLEAIITQVREKRSTITNVKEQVIEALKQVDYLKLAKKAAQWGLTFYTGVPHPEAIKDAVGAFKALLDLGRDKITPEEIEKASGEVEGLIKPSAGPKVPEHIEAFKKEFAKLLKVAEISKLIVLIDDLDRCLPETVIESMEAIRLFLFTEGTAFVIAADEAMVQYSVKQHFPDLPNSQGPRTYAQNYLEKLVQVPFRIPPLGSVEIQHYITLVLTEAALGPQHAAFQRLAEIARQKMREPWKAERITPTEISDALKGELDDSIKQLIVKSDQFYQILAEGTQGNPRQLKRFLNALLLRREIAVARGLEQHIELAVLAKLMLAEYYKDDLYSALETWVLKHLNGAPEELAALEQEAKQTQPTAAADGESAAAPSPGKEGEWKKDEWTQNWAALQPELAGKNLKPYFFISRDKKVFFPGLELPSRLAGTVELLMGNSPALMRPAVQKLDPKDAAQVAAEIRNRIISEGEFDKDPKGAVGLTVLAEIHNNTRGPFLELLKTLDGEKVGVWAGKALSKLITYAETAAEANALVEDWKKKSKRVASFFKATGREKK
jgi:predicted KAP-like P-loop ATPase